MLFVPRQIGSGNGKKSKEEEFPDPIAHILEKVNAVLRKANINATIKSFPQLRLTAPVLFMRVFEAYFWKKIPGVNYSPQSIEDHERNLDLLLNEFRKMYGYESLQNITGIDIVNGKQNAIETILDIFYGVHNVVQDKTKPSQKKVIPSQPSEQENQSEIDVILEQVSSLRTLQDRILASTIFSLPEVESSEHKHDKSPKKNPRPSSAPSSRLMRPTIASSHGLEVLDQKSRPASPPMTLQRPSRSAAFGSSADLRPLSPPLKPRPQDPSFSYDSWSGRKIPIEILDKVQEKNLKRLLTKRHPEKLEPPPVKPKAKPRSGEIKSEYPGSRIAKSVEQYNQKMKLEREGPQEEKKNPVIDIFSQPNSTYPIYQYLGPYDMLISIEHCHQCENHSKVLRHQSIEYHQQAIDIFRTLLYSIYSLALPVRVGIIKFQADLSPPQHNLNQTLPIIEKPSRIGAFEVQIAYKDHKNQIRVNLLHSKLSTQKWPSKNVIKKRLLSFVTSCNIPTISRDLIPSFLFSSSSTTNDFSPDDIAYGTDSIEPYPIGLVPWNQLKLSSNEWNYPMDKEAITLNSTDNNIYQIFDFRLNSIHSTFQIGSVINVSKIMNSYGYHEKYPQVGIVKEIKKKGSKKLLIQLKYLCLDMDVSSENCTPILDKDLEKNTSMKPTIDLFTVLSSYYTSTQSLLSLNSAISSTSYSTITPQPTRSAMNTGRSSSIPYVYFVLLNLSIYLSPKENTTDGPLSSNIQWKLLNSSDYSLPRQNDDEDDEQVLMLGNDDFYLTRESFYCQIHELVWHALLEGKKLGGDDNDCQTLRIKTNISLTEVMKSGIQIDNKENQGERGGDFFDVDLQLCYAEHVLDWICYRFGNKINITELLKLARPHPPSKRKLLSKSSSNMSSESEEIKNCGKSFSFQLEEEGEEGEREERSGGEEGDGGERGEGEEEQKENNRTDSTSSPMSIAPINLQEFPLTSQSIKNQLLIITEEVHDEERKQKENELEKQRVFMSINSVVQDTMQRVADQGNSDAIPPLSSPTNIHFITSSLRSRIQQVCLHIAPPEPNSIEASDAGNYLQTSKYRQGVEKLFHALHPSSTPRGNHLLPYEDIELDMNQFNAALSKFGIECNDKELSVLWATLDVDGNTHISPPELLSFLHYKSQIGYRQLGEIWNTLQQYNHSTSTSTSPSQEESDGMETSILEKMEDEMFHLLVVNPSTSTSTSTAPVIPANQFFEILKKYEMFSLLKPGDINILIAYFGKEITGKPITDAILHSSPPPSPRGTTISHEGTNNHDDDDWNNYLIRFDDFFSWLQPIDFNKISKRITRFLTAIINREGGLGCEIEKNTDVIIEGIPIHAVDPERTGYIQRKLFQIYVDSMGLPLTSAEVRSLFRHYGESSDHTKMRYTKLKEMLDCSSGGLNHRILPLIGGGSFRKLSLTSPPKSIPKKDHHTLLRIDSNELLEEDQQEKTGTEVTPKEDAGASAGTETGSGSGAEAVEEEDEACNLQIRISMIEFECSLFDTNPLYDHLVFQMENTTTSSESSKNHEVALTPQHKHGHGKRFIDEFDWDPIDISQKNDKIQIILLAKDSRSVLGCLEFIPMKTLQMNPRIAQTIPLTIPVRTTIPASLAPSVGTGIGNDGGSEETTEEILKLQIHCRIKDGFGNSEKMMVKKENVLFQLNSSDYDINTSSILDHNNMSEKPPTPLSATKSISQFDKEFNDIYLLQFTEDQDDDDLDDDGNNSMLLENDMSNTEFLEQFNSPAPAAPSSTGVEETRIGIEEAEAEAAAGATTLTDSNTSFFI